jgi:flagellar hook-associated protein 3 FlgL
MTVSGYGDLAQAQVLSREQAELKSEMTTLSVEVSTGVSSDTASYLDGDLNQLTSIEASLSRLDAYDTVTTQTALEAETMQTSLTTISDVSADLSSSLITVSSSSTSYSLESIGSEGRSALETVVSALNVQVAGQSLFAGVETDSAAVVSADDIIAELVGVTEDATTAAEVEAAVNAWFDDPDGYAATCYIGGDSRSAVTISDGDSVTLDTTANDESIREMLKGISMAALLDTDVLAGDDDERAALAIAANNQIIEANTELTYLQADIGITEQKIEDTSSRNEAEVSSLEMARSELIAVDSYEASTRLTEVETQLELLYTVMGRITSMSLVDYI